MDTQTSTSQSLWMDATLSFDLPMLERDLETDVCIVGAGISGMSIAYMLAKEGKKVVIIDAGTIGSGETERTTAHLSNVLDARYLHLEKILGTENAQLVARSHTAAITQIEKNIQDEQIDCDFKRVPGYLFLGEGEKDELLDKELKAAHEVGLSTVKRLQDSVHGAFHTGPCLLFPEQGQFHPLKYLQGLRGAIERMKGELYGHTKVVEVQGAEQPTVRTERGYTVRAGSVIMATNTPVQDIVSLHTKQAAYRSYVIAGTVPKGSIVPALLWDTADPYHYIRIQEGENHDVLIVGGEDHKTGQQGEQDRHALLEGWARKRFPELGEILYRWSGQIMESMDRIAFIGRDPEHPANVYVVTGDSGLGMTHGTIASLLIPDLIAGRQNPWEELYDPARKPAKAAGDFLKEAGNIVAQYGKWLTGGDVEETSDIAKGEGAVLREGMKKVAVYRDDAGQCHKMSAVCTHLGCIVGWNTAEKTWDCPCHGSRFDKTGKAIQGPAVKDLPTIE